MAGGDVQAMSEGRDPSWLPSPVPTKAKKVAWKRRGPWEGQSRERPSWKSFTLVLPALGARLQPHL